jgi:AcrR family transcriptional regulator
MLPTPAGQHTLACSRRSTGASRRALKNHMTEPAQTQSRSSKTKLRILKAARRRFGADGYEPTTIRAVAAEAAIDPSMVMRYFGSKEGLFAAAATFDLHFPNLAALPQSERGKRLVQHFLDLWVHEPGARGLAVLLRTAATNAGAAARIRKIFREQVVAAVAAVAPDRPSTRAALISSQFLGVAYCRYIVGIPELKTLDESTMISSLAPTIQRYLHGPIEDDAA